VTRLNGNLFWVRLIAAMAVVVCMNVGWARDAIVTTTDGKTFEGQVLQENQSQITLLVSGIRVPISRANIDQVQYQQTIQQQYDRRRAQLPDHDVDGRYQLAYWLFENESYKLAASDLEILVRMFPDDSRIIRLISLVADQLASDQHPPVDATTPPGIAIPEVDALNRAKIPTKQRISPQQINLIKVYEIDLDSNPVVVVPAEVTRQILTQYSDHPLVPRSTREQDRLRLAPGHKQLELIFSLRARELYSQIQVRDDPPALQMFRSQIHQKYVLNYCGTVACHGSQGAGQLHLDRLNPNSKATVYSNFLALQTFSVADGDIINRQRPAGALLLQYGLSAAQATTPHPEVPGWRPKFHNRRNELFETIEQWIDSLWKPTPEYKIEDNTLDQDQRNLRPSQLNLQQ